MKLSRVLVMVGLGIVAAAALSDEPNYCTDQPVPCTGQQTENGNGCSTGCPPYPEGCCQYVEWRVDCDEGPDQFYRTRNCYMLHHCSDPINPKSFFCNTM